MASAGLPASSSNVGLGILDKEGITTSQTTQQADYLQALQGELQQTIESIHGVTGAQVNLAMPEANTFAVNNATPTGASVLVDTGQGESLSGGEVQAIVHLVASSVPGLNSSQVTVADANGDLLSGPGCRHLGRLQRQRHQRLRDVAAGQDRVVPGQRAGSGQLRDPGQRPPQLQPGLHRDQRPPDRPDDGQAPLDADRDPDEHRDGRRWRHRRGHPRDGHGDRQHGLGQLLELVVDHQLRHRHGHPDAEERTGRGGEPVHRRARQPEERAQGREPGHPQAGRRRGRRRQARRGATPWT